MPNFGTGVAGGTGFQQLLMLPDTWSLTAVEEHAFPLGFI